MKRIFVTSLAGSAASGIGLVMLSAVTVLPSREGWRDGMMALVAGFLIAWLILAIWAGWRWRASRGSAHPSIVLERLALILVVVQVILVLLHSAGFARNPVVSDQASEVSVRGSEDQETFRLGDPGTQNPF